MNELPLARREYERKIRTVAQTFGVSVESVERLASRDINSFACEIRQIQQTTQKIRSLEQRELDQLKANQYWTNQLRKLKES